MWLLKDSTGKPIYLTFNKAFKVGRKLGSLVLSDDSVSRNHAEIIVTFDKQISQTGTAAELSSTCTIKDLGSKYGTYIIRGEDAEWQVAKQGSPLQNMDKIRFGVQQSIYTVFHVFVYTVTSGLGKDEMRELEKIMDTIDGRITEKWDTACTHMTVAKSNISQKLANAFALGLPIVPMEYWKCMLKAFEANEELPDSAGFAGLIKDRLKLLGNISVVPDPRRKILFTDLTFVMYDSRQYTIYRHMIELAGGKSLLYRNQTRNNVEVCDDNVIVVQLVESNTTQATGTGDANYMMACEELGKCRRRAVPASEIALAIIHCSIEKFCNPNHDHAGMFEKRKAVPPKKSEILAPDTMDVNAPPTSSLGKSLPKSGWLNETPECSMKLNETSNLESLSVVPDKPYNDFSVSIANASCLSQMTNPPRNSKSKSIEASQSKHEEASEKDASFNSERCINEESSFRIETNKIAMKPRVEEENMDVDVGKKRRRSGDLSDDRIKQKEMEKSDMSDENMMSEDEVFSDDQRRTEKVANIVTKSSGSTRSPDDENKERDRGILEKPAVGGAARGKNLPESGSKGPTENYDVDEAVTPRKRKIEKPEVASSRFPMKSPVERNETSSPRKKSKLPQNPEPGQMTVTKFLSPRKKTINKTAWTSVDASRHQRNSGDLSTSHRDSEDSDTTRDKKPLDLDISQQLLRIPIAIDGSIPCMPKFSKTFRKTYTTNVWRIPMDSTVTKPLWNEKTTFLADINSSKIKTMV